MSQGFLGQVDATEHAGYFLDAAALVQLAHGGRRGIFAAPLVHEQMLMALRGDLRQVGDAQHLTAFAEAAQQLPDHFGGRAAYTNVHFVEYQGRYTRGLRGDHLDRQADT